MSRYAPRLAVALLLALSGCRSLPPGEAPATATATPADVVVLAAPPADWAALHGRRVRIAAPLTITGNAGLDRDARIVASFGGRLWAPTEMARPGADAARVAAGNRARRLAIALPMEAAGQPARWRSGGTLATGIEGELRLDDGMPVLHLASVPDVRTAERPAAPRVAGDLRLATLNVENLFNGDGRGGGFPTTRGAASHDAYLRQRGKLVATLRGLDADVVALMEIENDGFGAEASITQLVDALNVGGGAWQAVATEATALGGDQIAVGIIYRADRVSAVGAPATLSGGPFDWGSRVPLAQAFRAGDGPVFTVIANHFKSKSCGDATGEQADQGDGQACWNPLRRDAADRLATWVQTDPTRSGTDLAAIVGDFNAYAQEDPIQLLAAAGWRDALVRGGVSRPYSFVFDAQAGRLDHVLVTDAMAVRIAGAAEWHANADEARNVGYEDDITPPSASTPWRSSDHDPAVVGFRLHAR